MFSIPFILQPIPHSILSNFKITKIQALPIYWTCNVERNSDETIIIRETKIKLIKKNK